MNDKCVVLNAKKMNFDGKLDFSVLSSDVTVYDDTTEQQLSERIQGADIIVTKEMPVSAEMIQKFPESVKLICEAGTGYNNIDLEAARKKGITICNIPAYSTERVAHTAIMMILNLSSAMQVQMKMLACGNHDNFTRNLQVPHVEVNGKTLGVIGAGHIGRKVIQIAQALDMNILVYTRTPREDEKGIHYVSLEELLKNSDYISMHCPLTESTKHMINKESLSLMKPSAFIINTSRGALIDEAALIEALENGTIAGAGLDVQETEPPEETNPLYTMDLWQAILLGLIQGLAEFLPVSSSGQLELAKAALGVDLEGSAGMALTIYLHVGTALATVVVFRKTIWDLLKGLFEFRWNEQTRYLAMIAVSMIPAGIAGLFFMDYIDLLFEGNVLLVGSMLILTAALLLFGL